MKQLLLRVDDQLHADLTAQAKATGRSVNSLANEVLSAAVHSTSSSRRDRLNHKLAALGIPDMHWVELGASRARRDAISASKGIRDVAGEALDAERNPR